MHSMVMKLRSGIHAWWCHLEFHVAHLKNRVENCATIWLVESAGDFTKLSNHIQYKRRYKRIISSQRTLLPWKPHHLEEDTQLSGWQSTEWKSGKYFDQLCRVQEYTILEQYLKSSPWLLLLLSGFSQTHKIGNLFAVSFFNCTTWC